MRCSSLAGLAGAALAGELLTGAPDPKAASGCCCDVEGSTTRGRGASPSRLAYLRLGALVERGLWVERAGGGSGGVFVWVGGGGRRRGKEGVGVGGGGVRT